MSRKTTAARKAAAAAPATPKKKATGVRVHPDQEQLTKFFENVVVDAAGCWIWQGPVTDAGLPKFGFCPYNAKGQAEARLSPKVPLGHRTAWAWFRGLLLPYPYWKVEQKCGVKRCVHPAHLRQVRVPQKGELPISTARLAAIFEHVTRTPKGCWFWTGSINASGYGVQRFDDGTLRSVDGMLYDWFVGYGEGQAPHNFQLFHRCLMRACVNPAHMGLVDHGQRWTAERIAKGDTTATIESTRSDVPQ